MYICFMHWDIIQHYFILSSLASLCLWTVNLTRVFLSFFLPPLVREVIWIGLELSISILPLARLELTRVGYFLSLGQLGSDNTALG